MHCRSLSKYSGDIVADLEDLHRLVAQYSTSFGADFPCIFTYCSAHAAKVESPLPLDVSVCSDCASAGAFHALRSTVGVPLGNGSGHYVIAMCPLLVRTKYGSEGRWYNATTSLHLKV